MDKETLGIYSQTDGVVYQRKGDKRQYHSQPQQHQADIPYIIVHGIYQVFLVEHFLDIGILFNQFLYFGDAVRIGIVGMQLDFDGGSERIVAEELLRVRTHRLSLLAECLLLGNVFRLLHKSLLVQPLLKLQDVALLHVVTDKHGETDVLLDVHGKIMSREHKEYDQPQQQ